MKPLGRARRTESPAGRPACRASEWSFATTTRPSTGINEEIHQSAFRSDYPLTNEQIGHYARNTQSIYTDLCPKCLHENGDARRTGTTGRFETREELEAWVWQAWTETKANQADIARQCRVSPTTVANILKAKRPSADKPETAQ